MAPPVPSKRLLRFLRSGGTWSTPIAALLALSCGGGDPTGEPVEPGTFLAFETDFRGFHMWESFPAPGDPIANSPHTASPRTVYLNRRPPSGSSQYPIGTIVVKEIETDDLANRDIVARVKRGGAYNAKGAQGWEWFELRNTTDGGATIVWRGVGPVVAGSYLGGASCNGCHGGGDDASVLLPAIHLLNF